MYLINRFFLTKILVPLCPLGVKIKLFHRHTTVPQEVNNKMISNKFKKAKFVEKKFKILETTMHFQVTMKWDSMFRDIIQSSNPPSSENIYKTSFIMNASRLPPLIYNFRTVLFEITLKQILVMINTFKGIKCLIKSRILNTSMAYV